MKHRGEARLVSINEAKWHIVVVWTPYFCCTVRIYLYLHKYTPEYGDIPDARAVDMKSLLLPRKESPDSLPNSTDTVHYYYTPSTTSTQIHTCIHTYSFRMLGESRFISPFLSSRRAIPPTIVCDRRRDPHTMYVKRGSIYVLRSNYWFDLLFIYWIMVINTNMYSVLPANPAKCRIVRRTRNPYWG